MSQNENDLPNAEERPSIGEVIREWAVSAAATVIIVLGIGYGIISIIRTEIRPIEQTVSSFESRFEKVDEQLVRADAKADAWFEKVDERLARAEAKADAWFEKVDERLARAEAKADAWFEKVDEQLARADAKSDAQFEKVDERFGSVNDRIDRLEAKVDLNAQTLKQVAESFNQMNEKMEAHFTLQNAKKDEQPNASLSKPGGEAPVKPLAESVGTEGSSSG